MNADTFYLVKGLVFVAGTILLVAHMSRAWNETSGWGQRLRYLTLLYFATVITAISVKQTHGHPTIQWFNVGVFFGGVLLLATMCVSLAEYRRNRLP